MKSKWLPLLTAGALVAAGCAHSGDLRKPAAQDDFGVQMAKINLWREAMFRFERAVQINPQDARAHNNLAVAYEANGEYEKARKEYLEALRLDRSNQYIEKNYSRFVEFLSRNRRREPKSLEASAKNGEKDKVVATLADAPPRPAESPAIPPPPTVPPTVANPNPIPPPVPAPPGGVQ